MGLTLQAMMGDAFTVTALTEAINTLPVVPGYLGSLGLFKFEGLTVNNVSLEYKQNRVSLLPMGTRGDTGPTLESGRRIVRAFDIPHFPVKGAVMAASVVGVRKFGSDSETEVFDEKVTDELTAQKEAIEATFEYLRASSMCGVLRDPKDGSIVVNFFTEFGLTEDTFTFNFSAGTEAALQLKCMEVKKAVGDAIGGVGISEVSALIDDTFFQNMLLSAGVRSAWETDYELRRGNIDPGADVFRWGGITWTRYRSVLGATNFFGGTNVARFFPTGASANGLYKHYGSPANFIDAVNKVAVPMYTSSEVMPHQMGIELHSQANPLMFCSRPGALKKGVST